MKWIVERELKFKTVPNRWEPHKVCDTLEEAEARVEMWNKKIDGGRAWRNGPEIVAYRVKEIKE